MSLYATFTQIIQDWYFVFPQKRSFDRALRLSICCLCSLGRRTLSRAIAFAGLDQVDWAADYRLFSRCKWECKELFRPILQKSTALLDEKIIAVAFDDTVIKKKGRRIPGARWLRDSLSPPFNINIIWGMRFLQASVLLPLYVQDKTLLERFLFNFPRCLLFRDQKEMLPKKSGKLTRLKRKLGIFLIIL